MTGTTLGAWLKEAARAIVASPSPRLDARLLARHALRLDEAGLIAQEPRALTAAEEARLAAALARRIAGEPVAYITGVKEFWGLPIRCRAPMLLPRPDSETLVDAALRRRPKTLAPRVLDLGTGPGSLLAALLVEYPEAVGTGVDYHAGAVALARENMAALGLSARATIREGDWSRGLEGPFDLVVANPPYIPEAERDGLATDIRDYEDPGALFAGPDGLSAYRAILDDAPRILAPGGLLIFELGTGQRDAVAALAAARFPGAGIAADADLAGRPRALVVDLSQKTD